MLVMMRLMQEIWDCSPYGLNRIARTIRSVAVAMAVTGMVVITAPQN